ncbi:MAG: murein biosynthesis integral membrane protein MurJ [Phycisphaerales bacterium]|nr:murein biosynthesis integral membrane protein MurJ [Phycisphaerales bacterium]
MRSTSLVTLASRFGGLARDVLVGIMFGDSALNSAFATAFSIPNLFRRLFGEGALSAAFIPEYTQGVKHEPDQADRLASLTVRWLFVATGLITTLAILLLTALLIVLPSDQERQTTILLTIVMLPFMPMICIAAILSGMLQVHGKYAAAASGPLILNTFIVATGLYFVLTGTSAGHAAAYSIAAATTLSGFSQCWWFARLLKPHARWRSDTDPIRPTANRMLKKFFPVLLGTGTLQLNAFMDVAIASYPLWVGTTIFGYDYPLDERSAGIMALSSRLYQFPLGVFGIAVASAVFPLLSKAVDDKPEFVSVLRRAIRLSLFIALPATVGLILVRTDALAAITPTYTPTGQSRAAAVLLGFAPGVWAYSINHVLTRAFYSRGDTTTALRVSLWFVGINLVLNLTLIWFLKEAGLAWSTSICAMLQTLVLAWVLRSRLHAEGFPSVFNRELFTAIARILALCAIMGGAVGLVQYLWPLAEGARWREHALRLMVCASIGGIIYALAALALGSREWTWLVGRSKAKQ